MSFLNPAGLWLLLGVPILIIIYLIRSQHEDHPVSSTYIWKLSSRFMKKKVPLQKIKKILMFAMQLCIIIAASLLAARPVFVNGESCHYIVIIDSSASMQIQDDTGKSRFEYALDETEKLSSEVENGHTFSIILASDNAYYLVQESTSRNEIRIALNNAECSYGSCNTEEALSLAQLLSERSKNVSTVFFTDKEYTQTQNVSVVNLDKGEWNVSVESLSAATEGKNTVFTGTITSYNQDSPVVVGLKIDDTVTEARIIDCIANEATELTFEAEGVSSFDTAELFVEVSDALQQDNAYAVCRKQEKTYRVTLVSNSPLYLETVLSALGNCEVNVASNLEEAVLSGQDLYIFDGMTPDAYPEDGSIIVFGTENLPNGITPGESSSEENLLTKTPLLQHELYNNLSLKETVVSQFTSLIGNPAWEPLLSCGNSVVMLTSERTGGLRFSVISFDLHDSNLPMQTDFVVFMKNLIEYSIPGLLKTTDFTAGSTVKLTVMTAAEGIYVELPDESIRTISTAGNYGTIVADEVGIYTAVMQTQEGGEYVDFFVHIPKGEVVPAAGGTLEIELTTDSTLEAGDAVSELWFWLAAIMLFLVLTEWGWYYHEQY